MTTADLIARLRKRRHMCSGVASDYPSDADCDICSAADALEQQAKRIGELERELEEAIDTLQSEMHGLIAERDALARDARRWRWVRDNSTQPVESWSCETADSFTRNVDAAIDAAMKEKP